MAVRQLSAVACIVALSFGGALASQAEARARVTPLQKVTEMLTGMAAKGKAFKNIEEVEFAETSQLCDSTRKSKTKSIEEAAAKIEQLTADIEKATSDAEVLAEEISELEAEIEKNEASEKDATKVRRTEKADYTAQHADFSESIDAISRAIEALNKRSADVPQALLQVQRSRAVPAEAKALVGSFLQVQAGDGADAMAPEANAYEFQSGGVVTMLEKLSRKFKDQLLVLEKEEMTARNNYQTLMQQLTDDINEDKATAETKTTAKAGRMEDAASAKSDKEVTESTKEEDEKVLRDTNAECHMKSDEYEKNQRYRADEIKAIEKAVEILSSDAVKGNAEEHLPAASLLDVDGGASALAQARSASPHRRVLVEFLQDRAQRLGSRYLAMVALRAQTDPFAKVKHMIKGLIVKLMEEANSEADHHGYCEAELGTNKMTRDNKASEVEDLTAKSDELTALTAQLTDQIAQLTDDIATVNKEQLEATKLREEEKATNTKAIADAKEAQVAVERATTVLKDFYGDSDDGAALLQDSVDMDAAAKAPYTGMSAQSGGILGMLEVVLSDFARLESETSSAEDAAASVYEKLTNDNAETIAVKETALEHETDRRQQAEETHTNVKKELELTQEELDAALTYYDKLKADCVDAGLSYEDRVAARAAEIQSLQEALQVLAQQDLS